MSGKGVPSEYAVWRLALRMGLDPDVVRAKRISRIAAFQLYASADVMYDDWMAESAAASARRSGG